VDDESGMRQFCRSVLETEHRLHCDEAADGILALEKIKNGVYDLVLTDIDMQRCRGWNYVGAARTSLIRI